MRLNDVEVLMTTYNGEKYIYDQLDSLLKQNYDFFSVSIYDDGSTDKTVSIIKSFIKENNLSNWKLTKNIHNKGWKKNFIDAVRFSKARFLLFCDQDDIWYENHINEMTEIMKDNNDIKVLCSNYEIISFSNTVIDKKKYFKNDSTLNKIKVSESNFNVLRPGCSYCLDGDFARIQALDWLSGCPHDQYFWILSLFNDSLYLYNKVLMGYRRHDSNNSGLIKTRKEMVIRLEQDLNLIKYLYELKSRQNFFPNNTVEQVLRKQEKFIELKLDIYRRKNLRKIIPLIFKYQKCYISWKQMVLEVKNCFLLN